MFGGGEGGMFGGLSGLGGMFGGGNGGGMFGGGDAVNQAMSGMQNAMGSVRAAHCPLPWDNPSV